MNRINKVSGSNRMSCESEKELDEVLGTRPSIKPLDFGTDLTKEIGKDLRLVFKLKKRPSNGPTWVSFEILL